MCLLQWHQWWKRTPPCRSSYCPYFQWCGQHQVLENVHDIWLKMMVTMFNGTAKQVMHPFVESFRIPLSCWWQWTMAWIYQVAIHAIHLCLQLGVWRPWTRTDSCPVQLDAMQPFQCGKEGWHCYYAPWCCQDIRMREIDSLKFYVGFCGGPCVYLI